MRKIRENFLVSSGDQAIYAAGLSMFNSDGTTKVSPGQLAIWDPKTAISLGSAITCSDYDSIVISQGLSNGKLRSCFGDILHGCEVKALNVETPICGVPDIWDFYIDSTIGCNENFSITITVDDDDTRNLFPWNKKETYTYSVDSKDCACSTCDSGFDAFKLACKLRDQINNNGYNELPVNKKGIFKNIPAYSKKFTASLLYAGATTSIVYCINPIAGSACEKCVDADVHIRSMKFDTDTVVTFTGTSNAAGDATLIEKLDTIVKQINEALGDNGSAVITKGAGSCCPWRLEINTCFGDFELHSNLLGTSAIVACTPAEDPFSEITIANTCPNCTALETKTFAAGLRIVSAPLDLKCDPRAAAPNPVEGIGLRKLEVFPTKGFGCGKSYVYHKQAAGAPENLGYHFQWQEFVSNNGGAGRGHENFVRQGYGHLGLPLGIGRESAVETICKETYCSYAIEHSIPYRDQSVYGNHVSPRGTTIVLIPSGDATTQTEFEAIINNYIPSCACPVKTAVTCA
jgi:hypothetical protein